MISTTWVRFFAVLTGKFNPLNAQLNPICHLLALLGAHYIFHVSGLRVKVIWLYVVLATGYRKGISHDATTPPLNLWAMKYAWWYICEELATYEVHFLWNVRKLSMFWVPVTTAWLVLRLQIQERAPIWMVAANKLNNQSWTADKG